MKMFFFWSHFPALGHPPRPALKSTTSTSTSTRKSDSRQGNDNEIQPIPGVSQISEFLQDKSSRRYFDRALKRIDGCEDHSAGGNKSPQITTRRHTTSTSAEAANRYESLNYKTKLPKLQIY